MVIRFGTFQRLAYFDRADLLEKLIDHAIGVYHPDRSGATGLLADALGREVEIG